MVDQNAPAPRHELDAGLARLHLITPDADDPGTFELAARLAAIPGVALQVRLKQVSDRRCLEVIAELFDALSDAPGAQVLVDDRVDVAVAAGATGVHVGDHDLPVAAARRILGPTSVLGATARTPAAARDAEAAGADYLGVGPVATSTTKTNGLPDPIGLGGLTAVVGAVDIPVVAIAGLTRDDVASVLGTGAHGMAVCAAVFNAPDPEAEVHGFLAQLSTARPEALA